MLTPAVRAFAAAWAITKYSVPPGGFREHGISFVHQNLGLVPSLTVLENLLASDLATESRWNIKWRKEAHARLPRDTLERLSYLLGIYKALQLLLPATEAADEWIRRPNAEPLFGGRSALERMLSGNVADLYLVRQYLDAQRG